MTPAVVWLIAEMVRLAVEKIQATGKLNTLTQEEAEAMVAKMATGLPDTLPTPEDLEKGPGA